MLLREITAEIEKSYPTDCALEWDNVGLLAGRDDKEVQHIYVALDATDEVIEAAVRSGADLLVTHHPLIFGGLKQVTNRNFIGSRVLKLLQNDISYYAMHTNYDVKGMAEISCRKLPLHTPEVLEVTHIDENGIVEGIGRIAQIDEIALKDLCTEVKSAFHLDTVRVFGDLSQTIRRAAICPGSGKSVIETALCKGADVLITGDIGHHEGIDAAARGMAIIDAGHYGMEHIFMEDMKQYLEERFPNVKVETAEICHPFTVV